GGYGFESRWLHHDGGALHLRDLGRTGNVLAATVDAKGGDEVFVQLEPDSVAGIDIHPVDPLMVALLGLVQCGIEPFGIAVEARENLRQSCYQWGESLVECTEF